MKRWNTTGLKRQAGERQPKQWPPPRLQPCEVGNPASPAHRRGTRHRWDLGVCLWCKKTREELTR